MILYRWEVRKEDIEVQGRGGDGTEASNVDTLRGQRRLPVAEGGGKALKIVVGRARGLGGGVTVLPEDCTVIVADWYCERRTRPRSV